MSSLLPRWDDVRALAGPLLTYWGATCLALLVFSALILWFEGTDADNLTALAGIWGATVLGLGAGQVLALARVRTWVALTVGGGMWAATFFGLFGLALADAGEAWMVALIILWMLFPFFLMAGLWSLRVHMGLLATWAPLVWLTACILLVAEQTGGKDAWFAGNKWGIWDLFTAPFLMAGVAVTLLFLASRELHRLHRWRTGPGTLDVAVTERRGRTARPTLGLGGLFVLTVLMVVLSAGSGGLAPFLWNTVPSEDGEPRESSERPDDGRDGTPAYPEPGDGPEQPASGSQQPQSGDGSGAGGPQEAVREAARKAGSALGQLLFLLLLALLGLFVFGPPTRRALLLRHLREPFWPVPPTRRVQQAWRIVEIALGDHGLHRLPGDTATSLVRRARSELDEHLDWVPLEDCAGLADRVVYGLGMDQDDVEFAGRHADMAYESLHERLGEGQRLKAWYRPL